MNKAIKEGSCGEDDRTRPEASCILELDARNLSILNHKVGNDTLSEM
jgi:hypothetical protein